MNLSKDAKLNEVKFNFCTDKSGVKLLFL